ncbi:MAG: hypothetical protein K9L88_11320 [Chromatiaceae bacterium]|nr:hypothetical protein [Chromatiaceae bacterium]
MRFDNCYISAWRAYRNGEAVWMACRQSRFALLQGKMPLIARILGTMIVWPATALWVLGHFLIFGTWPHWIYCMRLHGDCMEYVPFASKSAHAFPPILFAGERRSAGDRRKADRRGRPRMENPTHPDRAGR